MNIQLLNNIQQNKVLTNTTVLQNDDGTITTTNSYSTTWDEISTVNPQALTAQANSMLANVATLQFAVASTAKLSTNNLAQ